MASLYIEREVQGAYDQTPMVAQHSGQVILRDLAQGRLRRFQVRVDIHVTPVLSEEDNVGLAPGVSGISVPSAIDFHTVVETLAAVPIVHLSLSEHAQRDGVNLYIRAQHALRNSSSSSSAARLHSPLPLSSSSSSSSSPHKVKEDKDQMTLEGQTFAVDSVFPPVPASAAAFAPVPAAPLVSALAAFPAAFFFSAPSEDVASWAEKPVEIEHGIEPGAACMMEGSISSVFEDHSAKAVDKAHALDALPKQRLDTEADKKQKEKDTPAKSELPPLPIPIVVVLSPAMGGPWKSRIGLVMTKADEPTTRIVSTRASNMRLNGGVAPPLQFYEYPKGSFCVRCGNLDHTDDELCKDRNEAVRVNPRLQMCGGHVNRNTCLKSHTKIELAEAVWLKTHSRWLRERNTMCWLVCESNRQRDVSSQLLLNTMGCLELGHQWRECKLNPKPSPIPISNKVKPSRR
jgi:hypothetical protein